MIVDCRFLRGTSRIVQVAVPALDRISRLSRARQRAAAPPTLTVSHDAWNDLLWYVSKCEQFWGNVWNHRFRKCKHLQTLVRANATRCNKMQQNAIRCNKMRRAMPRCVRRFAWRSYLCNTALQTVQEVKRQHAQPAWIDRLHPDRKVSCQIKTVQCHNVSSICFGESFQIVLTCHSRTNKNMGWIWPVGVTILSTALRNAHEA